MRIIVSTRPIEIAPDELPELLRANFRSMLDVAMRSTAIGLSLDFYTAVEPDHRAVS